MSRTFNIDSGGRFKYEVVVLTEGEFEVEEWTMTVNADDDQQAIRRAVNAIDGHDYKSVTLIGENTKP